MLRPLGTALLALTLTLGSLQQEATPEPDGKFGQPDGATGGCDLVEDYQTELLGALDDHASFVDEVFNPNQYAIQSLSDSETDEIIADGEALVKELAAIEVPEGYAKGHEGVTLYWQVSLDAIIFIGSDASNSINYDGFTQALALILEGEIAIAKACPDEIEDIGGYIYISPEQLEDILSRQVGPGEV